MSAAFEPRNHPLARVVRSHRRVRDLVDKIVPEYRTRMAVADRAKAMISDLKQQTGAEAAVPASIDEVTDDWLRTEVSRRLASTQRDAEIQVLRELRFNAAEAAHGLLDKKVDALFGGLVQQLDQLMATAAAAVAAMDEVAPDAVCTASDAIQAGVADRWKEVTDLLPDLEDIRAVQRLIYQSMPESFDRVRCGDTANVSDPDARLYNHQHLDTVAPGWRSGEPLPWPTDAAERLMWCLKNNSGIWVPSPDQIIRLFATADAEAEAASEPTPTMTGGVSITRQYDGRGSRRSVDQSGHRFGQRPASPTKPHLLIQRR
jgi:hypothetical protein